MDRAITILALITMILGESVLIAVLVRDVLPDIKQRLNIWRTK